MYLHEECPTGIISHHRRGMCTETGSPLRRFLPLATRATSFKGHRNLIVKKRQKQFLKVKFPRSFTSSNVPEVGQLTLKIDVIR